MTVKDDIQNATAQSARSALEKMATEYPKSAENVNLYLMKLETAMFRVLDLTSPCDDRDMLAIFLPDARKVLSEALGTLKKEDYDTR